MGSSPITWSSLRGLRVTFFLGESVGLMWMPVDGLLVWWTCLTISTWATRTMKMTASVTGLKAFLRIISGTFSLQELFWSDILKNIGFNQINIFVSQKKLFLYHFIFALESFTEVSSKTEA